MRKIIMVEDKDTHRDMLMMALESLNYKVEPCASFEEVKQLVAMLPLNPSVAGVLLDLHIPATVGDVESLECGRDCGIWLRNHPLTKDIPIIVYSAYTDDTRLPGWCDVIRTAAMLKKHVDPIKEFERIIRANFR